MHLPHGHAFEHFGQHLGDGPGGEDDELVVNESQPGVRVAEHVERGRLDSIRLGGHWGGEATRRRRVRVGRATGASRADDEREHHETRTTSWSHPR